VNSGSPRTLPTDPERLSVRSDWLARVVNDCQTFVDQTTPSDASVLTRRLQEFVQSLRRAQNQPEKLVLRGLLLEVYVQLETCLGRLGVDETVRERGRHCWIHDGHRLSRPELIFQHACDPLVESWRELLKHPIHEQARRWIAANWAGPLSIDRLARELHVHPRTLRRSFRRHLGVSVHQHWRGVRAREAVRLLQETSLKIEAIALLVGCRHRSTFYQMVSATTGKTPTEIRQERK
jgi:AraC-like DNA-binding protein